MSVRRPRVMRPRAAGPALRVVLPVIATAALLATTSCGGESPTGPPPALRELPRALTAPERATVAGSNRFAWDLLRRVHGAAPDSSVFLSPLSASMALAMTAMGADGDTWTQTRDMLGFQGMERHEMARAYAGLTDLILGLDPTVDIAVANALWHRRGEALEAPFLDAVRTHFDARIEGLDFGDPAAVGTINGWVADATRGRIDEIVKTIPGNVVLYLMNAVYFKGSWRHRFDASDTRTADFHTGGGQVAPVRMMSQEIDSVAFASGELWDAVELPYGGGAWVMDVVVPRHGVAMADALGEIEGAVAALDAAPHVRVLVEIPRFELEWERILNDDLIALGMVDAFDAGRSDLSRMRAGGGLWVDEVKQKTFVRVDEEGTEAAAVTSVAVVESLGPVVRADRPFVAVIRERLTGTVLFAGVLVEPPSAP